MNHEDAVSQMVAMFAENYRGKFENTDATLPVWVDGLRGAYPETILAVAMAWIQSEPWPPTIADIRKRAVPPDPPRPPSTISPLTKGFALPRFTDEHGQERSSMHLAILRASRAQREKIPEFTPGGNKKALALYDTLIADMERTLLKEGRSIEVSESVQEYAAAKVAAARKKIDSFR